MSAFACRGNFSSEVAFTDFHIFPRVLSKGSDSSGQWPRGPGEQRIGDHFMQRCDCGVQEAADLADQLGPQMRQSSNTAQGHEIGCSALAGWPVWCWDAFQTKAMGPARPRFGVFGNALRPQRCMETCPAEDSHNSERKVAPALQDPAKLCLVSRYCGPVTSKVWKLERRQCFS